MRPSESLPAGGQRRGGRLTTLAIAVVSTVCGYFSWQTYHVSLPENAQRLLFSKTPALQRSACARLRFACEQRALQRERDGSDGGDEDGAGPLVPLEPRVIERLRYLSTRCNVVEASETARACNVPLGDGDGETGGVGERDGIV